MQQRTDFSSFELSHVDYGGSEKKIGVIYLGEKIMLKFRKKTPYGECINDVAEFLACHIFESVGIETQKTALGIYKGENVVACWDFVEDCYHFVPFLDLGESSVDEGDLSNQYTYEDIGRLIRKNKKLFDKEAEIRRFWDTYILDALLANPDRHGRNWGFLKHDGQYFPAPVFDNGNSLFSAISDEEEIEEILSDSDELEERVYQRPFSLILEEGRISDYFSIISSLRFPDCNEALKRVFPKINLDSISALVEDTDLSRSRKQFLIKILGMRYDAILRGPFERLAKE